MEIFCIFNFLHVKRLTFWNACAILRLTRDADSIRYLMIASMCAPFQAFMIPLVKLYAAQLGLTNSLIPVIYIATGLNMAFSVFLVRGFLNSVPMLIFYLLCQKQILSGVVQGSVKG